MTKTTPKLNFLKRFAEWFKIKPKIDKLQKYPRFEEGEVWWCHLGENVGHEEDGKGEKFLRPVVIIKKFNQRLFYGLPTTTKHKQNKYYYKLTIKDKDVSVLLSQMKAIDAKRLSYKQARLPKNEVERIKKHFTKIILGKK